MTVDVDKFCSSLTGAGCVMCDVHACAPSLFEMKTHTVWNMRVCYYVFGGGR